MNMRFIGIFLVLGLWVDASLSSSKAAEYQEPLLEDR